MIRQNMQKAINDKRIIRLKFNSSEKGIIERLCIPFDIGISRKYKDGMERFHFYDLNSPEGSHNLSILESEIIFIEITNNTFEPADYVNWKTNWIYKRDWGTYS